MSIITVSGEPGCREEEVARLAAQQLRFEFVNESRIASMMAEEFGSPAPIPERAHAHVVTSILARLATEHRLVLCLPGAEFLFKNFQGILRIQIVAPDSRRVGTLMLDRRLDRPAATRLLRELDSARRLNLRKKFGRSTTPAALFDLTLNAEAFESEQMVLLIEQAARAKDLLDGALLSFAAEAQLQFQVRLQLAKHGVAPPGSVSLKRRSFVHPSEEIFANLLDFYRIAWEYEPRSFPIQWDKDGKVLESFTPDFFLSEVDLFVELTTMKQSLTTKKNRKVKLLRSIYPEINIQVFYQKDFRNLIFKYGLTERPVPA